MEHDDQFPNWEEVIHLPVYTCIMYMYRIVAVSCLFVRHLMPTLYHINKKEFINGNAQNKDTRQILTNIRQTYSGNRQRIKLFYLPFARQL
ncbi:hypothetical protein BI375_05900 [Vibrio rotiferianus]|uniref:Uncharacterized protein n=1 Tax=Vibrio rotiferianus TaxID=190895 RepID=A0ABX3D883_9VIBR|nr:hypothetical protein BI375_05900 [Vibrio rotiferianus]